MPLRGVPAIERYYVYTYKNSRKRKKRNGIAPGGEEANHKALR
jgi:hypothetical protein